jgi:hypothetical protein
MQLIVIAGQAGVGKTTLANLIAREAFDLGFIPKLLSFASPLKRLAKEKGCGKEDNPKEYRKFCQQYGASKREEDPNFWINVFEKDFLSIKKEEKADLNENKTYWERCVVVDDCRYPNEVEFGLKYKGTLIFLSYGNRDMPDQDEGWRNHHSEDMAQLIDSGSRKFRNLFNCFIRNQDDEEELAAKILPLVPTWCGIIPAHNNPENLKRSEYLTNAIEQLIDLLLLGELEDEDEEEDDEEDT